MTTKDQTDTHIIYFVLLQTTSPRENWGVGEEQTETSVTWHKTGPQANSLFAQELKGWIHAAGGYYRQVDHIASTTKYDKEAIVLPHPEDPNPTTVRIATGHIVIRPGDWSPQAWSLLTRILESELEITNA